MYPQERACAATARFATPITRSPLTSSLPLFSLGIEITVMPAPAKRDLFPGVLELMVLRSLELEPLHGYALATRIQQRSRDLLQVEEGSLYPALQRLLKAGLVDAKWTTSQTNRRVRTYSLTAKGRKHLARETAAFGQMIEGIQFVLDSD